MVNGKGYIVGCVMMLLTGCLQQAPQRPSRRMSETPPVDSATLAMMEVNRRMALAADQQVAQAAQAQELTFALYDGGAWIHIYRRGDETSDAPKQGEERLLHLRVYDMNEQLLEDTEHLFRIGKDELPIAVDANIGELRRGGQARLIVPWYTAFGMQGTTHIPPYENVIIDLEVK